MENILYDKYLMNLNEGVEVGKVRLNSLKSIKADLNTLYKYIDENYSNEENFLKNITLDEIKEFTESIKCKYKPSSYNRKLSTWKVYFNWLVQNSNLIDVNYFNNIKQISEDIVEENTKEKDIISIDTVKEILKIANQKSYKQDDESFRFYSSRNRAIITILTCYGNRIEEILGSKFSDIKETEDKIPYIEIKKTRVKNRLNKRVYIANAIKDVMEEYLMIRNKMLSHNDDDYIFTSMTGGKLNNNYINEVLKNLCEKANIKKHITCHCFRHICTLALQEKSVPEYDIDCIIGWKRGNSMQQRYSNHLPKEKVNKIISATNLL